MKITGYLIIFLDLVVIGTLFQKQYISKYSKTDLLSVL